MLEVECDQCQKVFPNKRQLSTHVRNDHTIDEQSPIITCDVCSEVFCNSFQYRKHNKRKHNAFKYPCNKCKSHFSRKDNLEKHMKLYHNNTNANPLINMWINDGEKITPLKEKIPVNNLLNEATEIPQVIIKTSLPLVKMVISDILDKVVNSSTVNKCNICNKSYSSVFNLNKHMRNIHKEISKNKDYSISDNVVDYPTGTTCNVCDKSYSTVYKLIRHMRNYLEVWLILAKAHKLLSTPGKKSIEEREKCAQACEQFTKVFPLRFKRSLTRKMHVMSLILPKHIRDKGLYYEFLCLEQAGERAHNRFNQGETVWANIRSKEKRFFKIIKYVKNQDKSDLTIFNSKKVLYYK